MIEAPKQQMLGIFSVFVKWVSDVKQGSTGPCIRVRAVIGKQWSTIQIPLGIAPRLQKGDFIEVKGSVAALADKDGASNYLFVEEVLNHTSADGIHQARNNQQPQDKPSQREKPADQVQSSRPAQNRPQKRGGYASNNKAQQAFEPKNSSNEGKNTNTTAQRQAPPSNADQPRRNGYKSNARTQVQGSHAMDENHSNQVQNHQTQHVHAAQQQPGGYRSNQQNVVPQTRQAAPQVAPRQRPLRGYARNRARSQSY